MRRMARMGFRFAARHAPPHTGRSRRSTPSKNTGPRVAVPAAAATWMDTVSLLMSRSHSARTACICAKVVSPARLATPFPPIRVAKSAQRSCSRASPSSTRSAATVRAKPAPKAAKWSNDQARCRELAPACRAIKGFPLRDGRAEAPDGTPARPAPTPAAASKDRASARRFSGRGKGNRFREKVNPAAPVWMSTRLKRFSRRCATMAYRYFDQGPSKRSSPS